MPLTMADVGKESTIKRVGGMRETCQFLENLGFVEGSTVTVISRNGDNLIVKIKDARIAISHEMATRIMI